ncbi:efflux RND transporter periplasmic adaptor subunit [Flavobacterium sp. HSC-61S13]|uniref:efflux RND transporter periplasmic adaptor subunit n=1 Tax=Flavobacterium sp. HSC-61S13 TaxID=2910963 RepID=UPI0020A01CBA|nr:efflux RND transporter periplasmic adaptor subunit [Flavobacterium sp. HSC-61S13]MCP1996098.1 membrane fusion protein (multidrug efflux system) [Flavobacterium sp. HSC-61S13]
MKKIIYSITVLFLYSCSSKTTPESTEKLALPVIELKQINTETFKEYPATIEGIMDIEIRSRVDGHLIQLYVDEGTYVKKGDPLFKIDDLPYLEQHNHARAELTASEHALINAKLELDRLVPLIENKISSDYELKIAETNYKIAIAKVTQTKAAVATAKINVDFTTIKAPISGYVGRLPKKLGSLINRGDLEPLTSISNTDQVLVYFSLSELDFIDFKETYEGNTLTDKVRQVPAVSLLLADHQLYSEKGKIDMINGRFDKTTGAITLRAIFANPKAVIRSGNTGKIQLRIMHQHVFSVPQSATVDIQDKTFVYVLDEHNKVHAQAIQIIASRGNNYLFKSDLQFGNRIVTKGIDALADGDVVTVIEENL